MLHICARVSLPLVTYTRFESPTRPNFHLHVPGPWNSPLSRPSVPLTVPSDPHDPRRPRGAPYSPRLGNPAQRQRWGTHGETPHGCPQFSLAPGYRRPPPAFSTTVEHRLPAKCNPLFIRAGSRKRWRAQTTSPRHSLHSAAIFRTIRDGVPKRRRAGMHGSRPRYHTTAQTGSVGLNPGKARYQPPATWLWTGNHGVGPVRGNLGGS